MLTRSIPVQWRALLFLAITLAMGAGIVTRLARPVHVNREVDWSGGLVDVARSLEPDRKFVVGWLRGP
jgi:hypothetical protein